MGGGLPTAGVLSMKRIAPVMAIAVALAGDPAFAQPGTCETCPPITCGETKQIHADGGHTLTAAYKFNASKGDVVSFEGKDLVNDGSLTYHLATLDAVVDSESNGEAWICGLVAPESGEYFVLLDGFATWGWSVSLTMHCGTPPEPCTVAAGLETWTHVKALYR